MLKKLLSLLSDAAIYGVSSVMSQLMSFLLLPLFMQPGRLTKADFGILGLLFVVNTLFMGVAGLGIPNALFRRFNAEKTPEKKGEVLSTTLLSAVLSGLAFLAICWVAARPIAEHVVGSPKTVHLVELTLLAGALGLVNNVVLGTQKAARRVKTVAALTLWKLAVYFSTSIFFVIYLEMGVLGAVYGTLAAEVLLAVVQTAVTARSFMFWPTWSTWKQLASYGIPLIPHIVQSIGLILFGQYVVGHQLGLSEAGLYNVAMKFATPAAFIIGSIQSSWAAYKYQVHEEDPDARSFYRSLMTYYVAATCYLWVGVSVWGPEVLRAISPDIYHAAALLIPAASFVYIAQGVYFMLGTGIDLSDNTRAFPIVSFLGLITVVGGTFLTVNRFGSAAAFTVTGIGWIVMAAAVYYFAQKRLSIRYDWKSLFPLWGSAVAAVVVILIFQSQPLPTRLALAALLTIGYPLLLLTVLLRSPHERARVWFILRKVPLVTR